MTRTILRLLLALLFPAALAAQGVALELSGTSPLDAKGLATVTFPAWFVSDADLTVPYQVTTAGATVRDKTATGFRLIQYDSAGGNNATDWHVYATRKKFVPPEILPTVPPPAAPLTLDTSTVKALQALPQRTKGVVSTLLGLPLDTTPDRLVLEELARVVQDKDRCPVIQKISGVALVCP